MEYKFRTKPFGHQLTCYNQTKDEERFAVLWEMGAGKTKLIIDTFGHLFLQGKVNAFIVIAPRGVHRNWVNEEFPIHFPKALLKKSEMFVYQTSKANGVGHQKEGRRLLAYDKGPKILAITYSAIMTKKGEKLIRKMLEENECMIVADEASEIKTPKAKRSIRAITLAKYAKYRRVLTGTPITNSPFDIFMIMKFLSVEYWKNHNLMSYTVFKAVYGIYKEVERADGSTMMMGAGPNKIPVMTCVAYKNLEQLAEMIAPDVDRVLKEDVMDLPPKMYKRYTFDMNKAQVKAYQELGQDFCTWLDEDTVLEAPLVISRLIRFQQITSGFVPTPDGAGEEVEPTFYLGDSNPRMELLTEIVSKVPHKAIIWCKYIKDIEMIKELLGDRCVTYYGETSDDERAEALDRFKGFRMNAQGEREELPADEQVQWFVSNPSCGGTGLTLVEAKTQIYYNTSYRYEHRKQSEDRPHRPGQDVSVMVIDLVATIEGKATIDGKVLDSYLRKQDYSDVILQDRKRAWIENYEQGICSPTADEV